VVSGQSTASLQNNTSLDYSIIVIQSGTKALQSNQWMLLTNSIQAWQTKLAIMDFDPDTVMVPGDTILFDISLIANGDSIHLLTRFVDSAGSINLSYSVSGSGSLYPWYSGNYFHEAQVQTSPITLLVKYKAEADSLDLDEDITFVLQDQFIYAIDSSDFDDPNILNVMSYNIKLMPLVATDFFERGSLFPSNISAYQDVVVYQEVFSDSARTNYLTPAMEAEGFQYHTTILNDTALPNITSATNGGVIIYSKWPIENEDEIKYNNCSNNSSWDCLASKGVKYAEVNKLGVHYHVFGSHMEAGGTIADVQYRMEQYGEMRSFIDQQNISDGQGVIIAGDLNTSPKDGVEYLAIQDSLEPVIPDHVGYFESTFSYADTGRVIDHVWASSNHLIPAEANNSVITFRSADSLMWNIFDFSDHRTVVGRFVFPNIIPDPFLDTILCEGDDLNLYIQGNTNLIYQWFQDGLPLLGENYSTLSILNATNNVQGVYTCGVTTELILGGSSHSLSSWFFPMGPDTVEQENLLPMANVGYEDPCGVIVQEPNTGSFNLYPSLNDGRFFINLKNQERSLLEVTNTLGCVVLQTYLITNDWIEMPESQKGTFWVRIIQNGEVRTQKIIVY
jgi:endonuclease/exonuclease/phosphatase family metal-dependent hydrolase